jgi:hypothetical protein
MYDRIFYELWTFADFDRLCKLEKRGDEILKKSSPRKLRMEGGAVGHSFERDPPRHHPCQVWFNLFSGFRGEDLNVIFYQNMPNLHNRYISAERKISQKNPEYMLNYSLRCSCS